MPTKPVLQLHPPFADNSDMPANSFAVTCNADTCVFLIRVVFGES